MKRALFCLIYLFAVTNMTYAQKITHTILLERGGQYITDGQTPFSWGTWYVKGSSDSKPNLAYQLHYGNTGLRLDVARYSARFPFSVADFTEGSTQPIESRSNISLGLSGLYDVISWKGLHLELLGGVRFRLTASEYKACDPRFLCCIVQGDGDKNKLGFSGGLAINYKLWKGITVQASGNYDHYLNTRLQPSTMKINFGLGYTWQCKR